MTIEQGNKYFLTLQRMPGDTIFIDISKLSIAEGEDPISLGEIDAFTMKHTNEEIMAAIDEANIVNPVYLNGELVIQDNGKHNPLQVLTKEYVGDFNIETFLREKIGDKSFINNISFKLGTLLKDPIVVERFKNGAYENNIRLMLLIIFSLSYPTQRKFIIYLIDLYHKELKNKPTNFELKRDRAA
ncbi:MAG: hypothetical protein K2M17_04260 [Bacilli bacterium]|nr:hypothetical protein [Bacilli bacterium]